MWVWRIHSLHTPYILLTLLTHDHTNTHTFAHLRTHLYIFHRTLPNTPSHTPSHTFVRLADTLLRSSLNTPLPALAKVPRDWEAHRWLWPNWFFCCRKTLGRTSQSADITWQYRYRTRAVNQKWLLPGKLVSLLAVYL